MTVACNGRKQECLAPVSMCRHISPAFAINDTMTHRMQMVRNLTVPPNRTTQASLPCLQSPSHSPQSQHQPPHAPPSPLIPNPLPAIYTPSSHPVSPHPHPHPYTRTHAYAHSTHTCTHLERNAAALPARIEHRAPTVAPVDGRVDLQRQQVR